MHSKASFSLLGFIDAAGASCMLRRHGTGVEGGMAPVWGEAWHRWGGRHGTGGEIESSPSPGRTQKRVGALSLFPSDEDLHSIDSRGLSWGKRPRPRFFNGPDLFNGSSVDAFASDLLPRIESQYVTLSVKKRIEGFHFRSTSRVSGHSKTSTASVQRVKLSPIGPRKKPHLKNSSHTVSGLCGRH